MSQIFSKTIKMESECLKFDACETAKSSLGPQQKDFIKEKGFSIRGDFHSEEAACPETPKLRAER